MHGSLLRRTSHCSASCSSSLSLFCCIDSLRMICAAYPKNVRLHVCTSLGKKPHEFPSDSTLACRMTTIRRFVSRVLYSCKATTQDAAQNARSTKRANCGTERWAVPRPLRMITQTPGHWRAQQAHCTVVDSEWVETRHTPHKLDQALLEDRVWVYSKNSSLWTQAEQVQKL